jgi:hypothetical protein
MDSYYAWAYETLGRAQIGDERLVLRLVQMGASVARHPGGTITSTMKSSAEKEGAFRFVENDRVDPGAIVAAVGESTALNCADEDVVFVPIDQTDLTFTDRKQVRGLGPDGAGNARLLGATQVMTSLAVSSQGTPIGVMDLQYWLRPHQKCPGWKEDLRPAEQRESWKWIEAFRAVHSRSESAPSTRFWVVVDRGADGCGFFREVIEQDALVTIRACQNRVIHHDERQKKLFPTLRRQPVISTIMITLPRREGRPKRRARCQIRALKNVAIRMDDGGWFVVNALQLREVSATPPGQDPVRWILLTTHPLETAADCELVIHSYTCRWRVEDFHKAWKSGVCDVESSQLRSYAAIQRWATILAAVAARAERLKRLSRETPEVDALTEFSQDEVDATILYMEPKEWKPGDSMTLQQAVRLVAMAGGYMGRRGDGPPGSITIRRGLERILPAAVVLRAQRMRSD